MNHRLIISLFTASLLVSPALATEEDDLVRLPGQGEVKTEKIAQIGAERLAPGGGLMMSFDVDGDGRITTTELEAGILAAFKAADKNEDGGLTPIEQQEWAGSLPTRDESLFNPVRFDPNLDRTVSEKEFASVIRTLANGYAEEGSDVVVLASLKRESRRPVQSAEDLQRNEDRPDRVQFPRRGERGRY